MQRARWGAGGFQVWRLFRYPVKSMRGMMAEQLMVLEDGARWDRAYGVLECSTDTVLSAKAEGRLLQAAAFFALDRGGASLVVRLPERAPMTPGPMLDEALSAFLGRPCRLVAASEHGQGTYEAIEDFEHEDESARRRFAGPPTRFVDESHLHILSLASLETMAKQRPELDWRLERFRPNIVLSGGEGPAPELELIGRRMRVGSTEIEITGPCRRCVVITRAQPGGIERQLDVLRHLNAEHDATIGVRARVLTPGRIAAGDIAALC